MYHIFVIIKDDPCSPNPCQNNGQCQRLGSDGYACLCPAACTGYNCETCNISYIQI